MCTCTSEYGRHANTTPLPLPCIFLDLEYGHCLTHEENLEGGGERLKGGGGGGGGGERLKGGGG